MFNNDQSIRELVLHDMKLLLKIVYSYIHYIHQ
jgi:hypothetical protein